MHKLEELKELLTKELEILAMEDKISLSSLEKIHKLTDTIKNLDKISALEDDEGYSQRGGYSRNSYDGGSYEGGSYEGGSSYARRRRDSMGRYSREYSGANRSGNRGGGSRGGYSRAEGKEEMIEKIEEMMEEATNEKERQALQRCMSALENA